MTNEQFPFLLIEQNKNNQDDESDFSEEKRIKKNKKYDYNKFEKFKPKNQNVSSNAQIYLQGAENKVKSMLSLFLKDIEKENKSQKETSSKKNPSKLTSKDNLQSRYKRREGKRNSVASTNFHFGRIKLLNNPNKNVNNYTKNINNINNINKVNNGTTVIFQTNNQKKDIKNINFIFNNSNYNEKSQNKNINKKSSFSSSYTENSPIKKASLINKINLNESNNIWNDIFLRRKSKNQNISSTNGSISPINNKIQIVEKSNLNDSSINKLIVNDNDKEHEDEIQNNKWKGMKSFIQKRKYGSTSSISEGHNTQIKNNLVYKKKNSIQTEKSFFGSKIVLKNLNKNQDNIFKETNNTILSESSEWNLNQDSISEIKKINSNKTNQKINDSSHNNNNLKQIVKKQNTMEIKNGIILQNPSLISKSSKKKSNEDLNLKRKSTNNSEDLIKYLRNKFKLRTIKHILKKSIILRPEDLELNNKSISKNKISSKSLKSTLSIKNKKIKRKSQSLINLEGVKKKYLKLENFEKGDLSRKNKSSTNNIRVLISKDKKEKIKKKISQKDIKKIESIQNLDNKEKEESINRVSTLGRKSVFINYRVLRRKQNIYDSLDDEECDDAEEINHLFINPNSYFVLVFDYLLICSVIVSVISVPLYLAKTHNFCIKSKIEIVHFLNLFIEFMNLMDLFLNFFRGYYNWEEQLIYKKRKIIIHYIKGWFLFDLISAIPVYTLNKINEPYCNDYYLRIQYYNEILDNSHYLLLCNRLFKIFKIFSNNQAYKILLNKLNEYLGMIISICYILLAINYVACLYIFIGRNCYPNWILTTHLDTSSFFDIYICSLYILMMAMTTVGYGDITCYSFKERIFQIFLLIVGILAYSWAVSSFSNYIKKISEKSADFENKKQILDEIKLSNPNLPDELYEKIIRYLKFKNFHEKKLKNVIFECLPVSLKNNLICEMYKPIIKNFVFFKNFQNTDFIVRVILAFRPILADKNDILINNDDMVEDLMFVKHGVLSVELPINMSDPKKNIDKYINMSMLNDKQPENKKKGNTTILCSEINSKLNSQIHNNEFKNNFGTIIEPNKNSNHKKSTIGFNTTIIGSGFGTNIYGSTFGNKITLSEKEEEKEDIRYVRILCIRENEHFGDVMMFLEQRSPLRVRVKSKKSELFFLKKMDAIKISTSYPNIWRRINKKSVFNFQQIKKSINKIIEIYCVKTLNSIEEKENSDGSLYSEIIKKSKIGKKETEINIRPKNYQLQYTLSKDKIGSKSQSINYNIHSNSIKNLLNSDNIEKISNKHLLGKIALSQKKLNSNLNIDEIIERNKVKKFQKKLTPILSPKNKNKNKKSHKRVTFDKKVNDVFQENYKFYKKLNSSKKYKNSIIKEEPSSEDNMSYLKSTKSFKNITKISLSCKSIKKVNEKNVIKPFQYEDKDNYDRLINNNSNFNKKTQKTLKLDDSLSEQLINDERMSLGLDERSEDNRNSIISYDKTTNNEIYPGEEIKINKEENLFLRKVDALYPIKNNSNNNEINNNLIDDKKTKVELLLRAFADDNIDKKVNETINRISIRENSSNSINNIKNNKKNDSNKELNKEKIIIERKRWDKKTLAIFSNISLKFNSSYENSNLICGQKLIKNKINQYKLKQFLIKEILNSNIKNRNSLYQISHKKLSNINPNYHLNTNDSSYTERKDFQSSNNTQSSSFLNKKKKKNIRKCKTLKDDSSLYSKNNKYNQFKRTASFNENITQKNKKLKGDFKVDLNDAINNVNLSQRKMIKPRNYMSTKNIYSFYTLNEKNKKSLNKKGSLLSKNPNKKKKDNLLSKINLNIQKTNQNLNNPDEFYSNYFHSLLGSEPGKNNKIGVSIHCLN